MQPTQRAALLILALLLVAAGSIRARRHGDPAAPVPGAASVSPPAAPAVAAAVLDVNVATAHELTSLPGIGPAIAARVVAYRTQHGAFVSVDDLVAVQGIGPRLMLRLKPFVRVKAGPVDSR